MHPLALAARRGDEAHRQPIGSNAVECCDLRRHGFHAHFRIGGAVIHRPGESGHIGDALIFRPRDQALPIFNGQRSATDQHRQQQGRQNGKISCLVAMKASPGRSGSGAQICNECS